MKEIKIFLNENRHFYLCLLFIPILIWFKYLEITIEPQYMIHTALDDKLPFIKEFVVPYLLWFPYMIYGIAYTGLYSKKNFYKVIIFIIGGMSVAYIAYMIFPNAQNLRPTITNTDLYSQLVKFLYRTDTPTNVCPSIHVINTIAIDVALHNSETFKAKPYGKWMSSFLAIMICLSTLFIKQHSVIDAVCGLLVSILFYIPLYQLPRIMAKRTSSPVTADTVISNSDALYHPSEL